MTIHRLMLLRHAKSSWDQPDLSDHDRPLAPRGRRAAKAVAERLRELAQPLDLVLCSSAARTVETLERIRPALPAGTAVEVDDRLYEADVTSLLARVRGLPTAVAGVMIIGHNPGMEQLAATLVGDGDPATRSAMNEKFPTAALARLAIDRQWSEVEAGTAVLEEFWTPR